MWTFILDMLLIVFYFFFIFVQNRFHYIMQQFLLKYVVFLINVVKFLCKTLTKLDLPTLRKGSDVQHFPTTNNIQTIFHIPVTHGSYVVYVTNVGIKLGCWTLLLKAGDVECHHYPRVLRRGCHKCRNQAGMLNSPTEGLWCWMSPLPTGPTSWMSQM